MSADILNFESGREALVAALWEAFRLAQIKSKETMDVADGIAAGDAYRSFLDLFLAPEQRCEMGPADVVRIGR